MTTDTAFIERPIFTPTESRAVLTLALKCIQPLEGEEFLSAHDILDGVEMAIRETVTIFAIEQFSRVATYSIS